MTVVTTLTESSFSLVATLVVLPSAALVYSDYQSNLSSLKSTSAGEPVDNQFTGYPESTCAILNILHNFCLFYSAWLVVAITLDRNWAIIRPFRRPLSVVHTVAINGVLATSCLSSALVSVLLQSDPVCSALYVYSASGTVLTWLPFILFYLMPMGSIVALYCNIYRAAQKARTATDRTALGVARIWTVEPLSTDQRRRCLPANKAVKTSIVTVGLYFFLWSPYWFLPLVLHWLYPHASTSSITTFPVYVIHGRFTVVTWLMYTSISINPLLYSLLDRTVRSEIRRQFKRFKQRISTCQRSSEIPADPLSSAASSPENFLEFLERTN